jgi:hypothetical protein
MAGVLVGCDRDVVTSLPQYMVSVNDPLIPDVSEISKHSSACIHQKTLSMIHIQNHTIIDHILHLHKLNTQTHTVHTVTQSKVQGGPLIPSASTICQARKFVNNICQYIYIK